jgi:hypothetical protein
MRTLSLDELNNDEDISIQDEEDNKSSSGSGKLIYS